MFSSLTAASRCKRGGQKVPHTDSSVCLLPGSWIHVEIASSLHSMSLWVKVSGRLSWCPPYVVHEDDTFLEPWAEVNQERNCDVNCEGKTDSDGKSIEVCSEKGNSPTTSDRTESKSVTYI